MDKYKKEALKGLQIHNQRERKSQSNPDIDYERSKLNYDLHNEQPINFLEKAQNRIDELQFDKAVRKDAVYMCGIILSSDKEFFKNLDEHQTKKFFWDSYDFMAKYVGNENIISATVHMDEKTPHMHFMHVPITKDKRLCAKDIYTRESLKKLQTDFVIYMQNRGHLVERGVEKGQGSAKKHLDTPEFKQQMEALNLVKNAVAEKAADLDNLKSATEAIYKEKESVIAECSQARKNLEKYVNIAQAAEAAKTHEAKLTKPGITNARKIYDEAQEIIAAQKKIMAVQLLTMSENKELKQENKHLLAEYQKVRYAMENQAENHKLEVREFNTNLEAAICMRDYYQQSNAKLNLELKSRDEFIKQPHIRLQYLAHQAAKQPKPEKQTMEVVAAKSQAHTPQKRNSGFER